MFTLLPCLLYSLKLYSAEEIFCWMVPLLLGRYLQLFYLLSPSLSLPLSAFTPFISHIYALLYAYPLYCRVFTWMRFQFHVRRRQARPVHVSAKTYSSGRYGEKTRERGLQARGEMRLCNASTAIRVSVRADWSFPHARESHGRDFVVRGSSRARVNVLTRPVTPLTPLTTS